MNTFLWTYAIKDLFRQKTRTLFGILGITVSLLLLTSVSIITDSVSYNFIDFLTLDAGTQDMVLSKRPISTNDENFTGYFDFREIIPKIHNATNEIGNIVPRGYFRSEIFNGNETMVSNQNKMWICAIDIALEEEIKFGSFQNLNNNLNISNGLPVNQCIVSESYARTNQLNIGEKIHLFVKPLNSTINLTIASTYGQKLKFPIDEEPEIIVDLTWWGNIADLFNNNSNFAENNTWNYKVNRLLLKLSDAEGVYDVRNVKGTESYIAQIGAKILTELGLDSWKMDYPKLELLFVSEFLTLTMNILFITIGIISMLISGILINAILSTSVEERIKEFGINRVLGARKTYNLKLILIQSSFISFSGTTLGIILAALAIRYIGIPFGERLLVENGIYTSIAFFIDPMTIISSYLIGVGVSMVVSISPALKVMRMKIVESINPYRTSDEVYHMEKEGSANVRLIIIGIILAANAGFIYFLLPRIIISFQFGILASVLIITMMVFLIGVSVMAIGFMPILIRLLVKIFETFNQKLMNIVRITVHRYQRRNLSTSIMFVLSFSFIIFTTSMVQIQIKQVGGLIQYEEGSDLVLRPDSYDLRAPTVAITEKLLQIDGIERVSSVIASVNDLEDIYSEENKDFEITLGDYINFQSTEVRMYAVDENYIDTVYQNYIIFTEGNKESAFNALYNTSEIGVIISASIASSLRIHLGDIARLTITRGTEEEPFLCRIVGVAKSMPGMQSRFSESGIGAAFRAGGVLISPEHYTECMNIPGGNDAFLDKIFIKVKSGYDPLNVASNIESKLKNNYKIEVDVTSQGINEAEQAFLVVKYLFLAILIGTVLIALFGLISSSYSSILERKREIGILRTLGLHGREIEHLFLLENLILLLSSSTSGGIIGYLMALGLSENMTLFIRSPRIIAVPWDIILIVYSVSLVTLFIGMRWLMRKLRKQNLIEIFRETL
ncbi:MAG: ABC transporter permease [Candidatus Lokiarchaeota archaeon]|nr:ABC transporter permease [Candidatus Harpocratesius repetitus]